MIIVVCVHIMKVAIIFLGGGAIQNDLFWPSFNNCFPGYPSDFILVHRNFQHLPLTINYKYDGKLILENKINNGEEVPHRAFGAYKNYWKKYQDDYDIFGFISDDVVIRRDNWLKDIVDIFKKYDKIGAISSQIFNGGKKYPHPSHIRAPFWFAKSEALKNIKWEFNNDHDGEMKIGDQIANAGYIIIQIGNKINFAYDSHEKNHITQLIEKKFFSKHELKNKFSKEETDDFFMNMIDKIDLNKCIIKSPFKHIGVQNFLTDIEPFNYLIYNKCIDLVRKYNLHYREILKNTFILED